MSLMVAEMKCAVNFDRTWWLSVFELILLSRCWFNSVCNLEISAFLPAISCKLIKRKRVNKNSDDERGANCSFHLPDGVQWSNWKFLGALCSVAGSNPQSVHFCRQFPSSKRGLIVSEETMIAFIYLPAGVPRSKLHSRFVDCLV